MRLRYFQTQTPLQDTLHQPHTRGIRSPNQTRTTQQPTPNNSLRRSALKDLKNNPDVIIKQADKGNGIASDYGLEHLSDQKIYQELAADPTPAIAEEIKESIQHLHDAGYIEPNERNFIKHQIYSKRN